MNYGIQEKHSDIGEAFVLERGGKPDVVGICDRVEIQPAIYRNVKTSKKTAIKKIRLRLRPAGRRAIWSDWMPLYPK